MRPVLVVSSCLLAVCSFAHADSFTGTFAQDDDIQLFNFTIGNTANVTMQTFSFGGGVNGAATVIAPGGFAPVLTLFDSSGNELITDHNDLLGNCTVPDPASGFCWDAQINSVLSAGTYTLALTEDDNYANGPTLADGFLEQGNGNFTAVPPFSNSGNPFTLVDGSPRTSAWAVDITSNAREFEASEAVVPEPSARLALLFALVFVMGHAGLRRLRATGK